MQCPSSRLGVAQVVIFAFAMLSMLSMFSLEPPSGLPPQTMKETMIKQKKLAFRADNIKNTKIIGKRQRQGGVWEKHSRSNKRLQAGLEVLAAKLNTTTSLNDKNIQNLSLLQAKPAATMEPNSNRDNQTLNALQDIQSHKSEHCLTQACFDDIAKNLARAFPDQTQKEKWCFPRETNVTTNASTTNPNHQGLMLVKVPKAASSTMAGVVLRLGSRHNCDMDKIHWAHQKAYVEYAKRDVNQSLLLLSVRDPGSQLISHVYWSRVSQLPESQRNTSDEWLLRQVMDFNSPQGTFRRGQGGMTTQYASTTPINYRSFWSRETRDIVGHDRLVEIVRQILLSYDFILLVERMDESLVALSLLLGVSVGDVLVTSSKVSGVGGEKNVTDEYVYAEQFHMCLPMVPSFSPPMVKKYIQSDLFRSQVYGDLLLHSAVNQSLDLTIEHLGQKRFQTALKEYRYWKAQERSVCASRVEFPCSHSGKVQHEEAAKNCYLRDLGCGFQCIGESIGTLFEKYMVFLVEPNIVIVKFR